MISFSAALAAVTIFTAGMLLAGLRDAATMTISNRLVLILLASFIVLAPTAGMDLAAIAGAALGAAAVLLAGFTLFALGWIGGGDAKLAGVAVLWLGLELTAAYLLTVAVAGAVLTLVLLQFRMLPFPALLNNVEWPKRLHDRNVGVPYGVALAAGALILLPQSPWPSFL